MSSKIAVASFGALYVLEAGVFWATGPIITGFGVTSAEDFGRIRRWVRDSLSIEAPEGHASEEEQTRQ